MSASSQGKGHLESPAGETRPRFADRGLRYPLRSMRIAYFAHVNAGRGSGVVAKMASQVRSWRSRGHEVRVFLATSDLDATWHHDLGDAVVARYGGPLSRIRAMSRLVSATRRFEPDVVYLRWELFYPPMIRFPKAPLAVEINTDDLRENALGSRIRAGYSILTRRLILGRASALVFVTSELSRASSYRSAARRRAVISNGIDLAEYPSLPPVADGPRRLVFVGTPEAPWHGVDKLVSLAGLRPTWQFDIVGLADEHLPSPPNVTWHGTLERTAVLDVMARADVGIGTLALHRKAMDEASPLKVREYLAVGLPVIYGYTDPDADGLEGCVLRIANTETNVVDELGRIDAFVGAARGVRVPRSAIAHLDVRHKEAQRLSLFESLAGA
jgi:glycosyltransferase involved in cell wall biosynthesis